MSTLDRLPKGKAVATIRNLEQDARELKSFQTLGYDSVVSYRLFSADAWDVEVPSSSTVHTVNVEFLPDDMTFGGALCYQLVAQVQFDTGNISRIPAMMLRLHSHSSKQAWTYSTKNNSLQRFKFYFFTTGSGTFTANII